MVDPKFLKVCLLICSLLETMAVAYEQRAERRAVATISTVRYNTRIRYNTVEPAEPQHPSMHHWIYRLLAYESKSVYMVCY